MTKKNIEREFLQKQMQKTSPSYETSPIFDNFTKEKTKATPSFGSARIIKAAENIMLDPIKNMMVLDPIMFERFCYSFLCSIHCLINIAHRRVSSLNQPISTLALVEHSL